MTKDEEIRYWKERCKELENELQRYKKEEKCKLQSEEQIELQIKREVLQSVIE